MFIHVSCIMTLLIKTSPADLTIITILSRVNLHVTFENVFIRKLLLTEITRKWRTLTNRLVSNMSIKLPNFTATPEILNSALK